MTSADEGIISLQVLVPLVVWKFESSSGQLANCLRCNELAHNHLPEIGGSLLSILIFTGIGIALSSILLFANKSLLLAGRN